MPSASKASGDLLLCLVARKEVNEWEANETTGSAPVSLARGSSSLERTINAIAGKLVKSLVLIVVA